MHGEDGAQLLVGSLIRELAGAVVGVVLPVGLGDAHIQLAGTDGVEIVDRATGRLDRAADAVFLAALVDQAADGASRRIIDAGYAAGADGDEYLVGRLHGRSFHK